MLTLPRNIIGILYVTRLLYVQACNYMYITPKPSHLKSYATTKQMRQYPIHNVWEIFFWCIFTFIFTGTPFFILYTSKKLFRSLTYGRCVHYFFLFHFTFFGTLFIMQQQNNCDNIPTLEHSGRKMRPPQESRLRACHLELIFFLKRIKMIKIWSEKLTKCN